LKAALARRLPAVSGFPTRSPPAFEEQLVVLLRATKKTVTVSFPEDYQAPHLAGKSAVFECKVKESEKARRCKSTTSWAKNSVQRLRRLKSRIRKSVWKRKYTGASRAVYETRPASDEADKMVRFDLPPSLVEPKRPDRATSCGTKTPRKLKARSTRDRDTDEQRNWAERRVRLGLLLAGWVRKAEVR